MNPITAVIASVRTALIAAGGMSQQHSTLALLQHTIAKHDLQPGQVQPYAPKVYRPLVLHRLVVQLLRRRCAASRAASPAWRDGSTFT